MKKFLHMMLLAVLCLVLVLLLPQQANAASTGDLTFKLNSDGESYSVTDCKQSASGDLEIPATYNSKPVIGIGGSAFYNCTGLTSVTIPDSVTSIGDSAFRYCDGLTNVTIPDSVTSIGSYAFAYCESLTSVTIGDSVTSIGDDAFRGCSSLTSVTIGDSVTSIGSYAFRDCTSLTSISIGDSVTSIGSSAFSGCSSLESITIPFVGSSRKTASVQYQRPFGYIFGASSYTGGVATKQYYYGSSTSSTDSSTYYIPRSLKSVTVTGGNLLYGAFYNCSNLTCITIPDSVTSIGSSAFYGCSSLTSVTIPDSVTSIGSSAFSWCTSLTSITIGDSVTSIGFSAFSSCASLTSITIGDSVTSIGSSAFSLCTSLTSITIPDSVTSIGSDAFQYCSSLVYNLYDNGKYLGNESNPYVILVDTASDNITSCKINGNTRSIGSSAFSGCSSLMSIIVPDSVISIGSSAFSGCSSLESMTIPFVGSSKKTPSDAYQYPFGYIFGTFSYTGGVATQQYYGFSTGATYYSTYYIPGGLKTVTVTGGKLSSGAFSECNCLTSITIGNSVTSIGDSVFYNCTSLTSITIPDSVTSIGSDAFQYCSSLVYNLYDNGKYLGNESNPYVILVDTASDSITSCKINENTRYICSSAFAGCSNLTSLIIPNSVTSVGDYAFSACGSLKHIAYGGTKEQWVKTSFGIGNSKLTNSAIRHYEIKADDIYYTKNCVNIGMFCSLCNDFLTKEKAESGEHTYNGDEDTSCDDCGYTRTVVEIAIGQYPKVRQYSLCAGVLNTAGGRLNVTYSDGTMTAVTMTADMVFGFDNCVYGIQTLTVIYDGRITTYTVRTVADYTPDEFELLTRPNQTSYWLNQEVSLAGLTLKGTYGNVEIELAATDVTMDAVDMTTAGIKTVTVRYYDAVATFLIYVHEKKTQTIDSALYPESKHNYVANTDDTQKFTCPGADKLVLTFSEKSYAETNCDYIYILDKMGNQIGQFTGSLANLVVTVPGDTVQIRLISDDSVNKYGYAFSSIEADAVDHPGEEFCEICGTLKAQPGQKIVLQEDKSAISMTIPVGVTVDLNGYTLTVDSLASFGQIIDSVGGGGLIVTNFEATGNDWLPIKDASGCYRFYEYEQESLGTKTTSDGVIFGFALDFADSTAYTALLATDDVQVTVTLAVGDNTQTYAFSRELIAKYVDLVAKYPTLQPYLRLNVTGLDAVTEGTVITVTPSISAVGGKLQTTGAIMTYTA